MWIWLVLTGFLAGVISGMGIGGGALLIPALVIVFGMGQQAAQKVNLLFFLPTAAMAVLTHRKNGNIETKNIKRLLLFGFVGAAAGAMLAMWVSGDGLRRTFGIFLLGMAAYELYKAKKVSQKGGSDNDTKT